MNYLPYRDGESKTEPMNQLEKEMQDAMWTARCNAVRAFNTADYAKIGAEVAIEWIEKAMNNLIERNTGSGKLGSLLRKQYESDAKLWLEQNGLKTPEVSNTKENP